MLFHLAADDGDAEVQDFLDVGRRAVEQGQGAADVKAADDDRQAGGAEFARQIDRPGVLIGLHAGQADDGFPAGTPAAAHDLGDVDLVDRLIEELNVDVQVFSQRLAALDIFREAIQARHRVTGQNAPPVTQHVAVVVILGRLQ